MLFSSITFMFFYLPITMIIYEIADRFEKESFRIRNLVLFIASCMFYAWGEPRYIFLMLAQIVVSYGLTKYFEKTKVQWKARTAYVLAILLPLASLFYFKYSGVKVALPIGISFYTFQIISYVVDVKRGRVKVPDSILTLGTYVALFPQLIAGPIVRYSDIEKELSCRKRDEALVTLGLLRFICGLSKKILIANVLGEFVSEVMKIGYDNRSLALSWGYALAVSLQIYFDFSGYSDMAIGLGAMFGFHIPENFRYPFISKSMTEFWRRWHITLGAWFRDYVYIPLGGNRVAIPRWILNIFVVWSLTGIWHGAGWNFLVWGLFFGVLLVVEKLVKSVVAVHDTPATRVVLGCLKHVYVVVGVMISFLVFHADNMFEALKDIMALFRQGTIINEACDYLLRNRLGILLIGVVGSTPLPHMVYKRICSVVKNDFVLIVIRIILGVAAFVTCVSYLIDGSFNPFLYFRF